MATPPGSPAIGAVNRARADRRLGRQGAALAAIPAGVGFILRARDRHLVKSNGTTAAYRGVAWVIGDLSGARSALTAVKVVGARGAAMRARGGRDGRAERDTPMGSILAALRTHGLIATC